MASVTSRNLAGAHRGGGPPPLVSVITVVRNAACQVEATLKSLLQNEQRSKYEVIVIDGASTDGTLDVLKQYSDQLDYWISEPDRGVYDAMNKGISVARGAFLYHLNVGDGLIRMPIEELQQAAAQGYDIVAFRVSVDGCWEFISTADRSIRHNNTIHHQGAFYRRDGFPGYDPQYRVFADFDLNQRMVFGGARFVSYDGIVARHSTDGISHRSGSGEFFEVIRHNCGNWAVVIAFLKCKWRGLRVRLGALTGATR